MPTPCLRSRTVLPNGNIQIVVLTVQASTRNFARSTPVPNPDGGTTGGGTTGGGTPDPETAPPTQDPAPAVRPPTTKLTAVTGRVVRFACPRAQQRTGVVVGRARACFRLVLSARLIRVDTGAGVGTQPVRFASGPRTIGFATTTAAGVATLTRPVVVPVAKRRSLATAKAWIRSQFFSVIATHQLKGTALAVAPPAKAAIRHP